MKTRLLTPDKLFRIPVRYEIPIFQRRYVWKQAEQWEPLWDDVEALALTILEDGEGKTKPHFMGAVVIKPVGRTGSIHRGNVVDGQQRLTTLQLLLDAIQEILEDRGHSSEAERLSDLVHNESKYQYGDPEKAFKVWPTLVDRAAFQHAMSNELSVVDYKMSRIVKAHEYLKGQVRRWLDEFTEEGGNSNKAAGALEDAVSHFLELVVIDLGDADDPHVIFETMNARGTPLLQSDMVKNKMLYDARIKADDEGFDGSPEQARLWSFDKDEWWAKEVGRGLQRRPRIDVYLNHWLTLRNWAETKPYDEFRVFVKYAEKRSSKGETVFDIACDIGDLGSIYHDIEEGGINGVARFLERRNVMNFGVVTPLLLWLLSSNVPPTTLAKCIRALESFLVRRVVCGYSARSYGKLFVGLIKKLGESPVERADRIVVEYLSRGTARADLWPDDKELSERFVAAPLYQWLTRGRLRMVLTGIEEQLRTAKAESQDVPRELQVEHVMPQAWQLNWSLRDGIEDAGEAAAERDRTIHTIGNLTLVSKSLNPSLSNGPWKDKRVALADHSTLFLNKQLVNKGPETWDERAIGDRAKWLCKHAVEVWPHVDAFDTAAVVG